VRQSSTLPSKALRPILAAASEAAHALVPEDQEEACHHRIIDVGLLADDLGGICGAQALVLLRIMGVLEAI
jgi:hypothetical protein